MPATVQSKKINRGRKKRISSQTIQQERKQTAVAVNHPFLFCFVLFFFSYPSLPCLFLKLLRQSWPLTSSGVALLLLGRKMTLNQNGFGIELYRQAIFRFPMRVSSSWPRFLISFGSLRNGPAFGSSHRLNRSRSISGPASLIVNRARMVGSHKYPDWVKNTHGGKVATIWADSSH
jgi:hypothetical protein